MARMKIQAVNLSQGWFT